MWRPEFIAKQGRHPSGILGWIVARVMATETTAENAATIELLDLQPYDRVLEIGFGHGRTVAKAAAIVRKGFVAGVDWSERMVEVATHHNRRLIAEGRIELKRGLINPLAYANNEFDKVYSVHTIYFWENPIGDLREIARVMKPGARFVLGFRPKDDQTASAFPETIYTHYASDEVRAFLEKSGFGSVQIVDRRFSRRIVCFAMARRA